MNSFLIPVGVGAMWLAGLWLAVLVYSLTPLNIKLASFQKPARWKIIFPEMALTLAATMILFWVRGWPPVLVLGVVPAFLVGWSMASQVNERMDWFTYHWLILGSFVLSGISFVVAVFALPQDISWWAALGIVIVSGIEVERYYGRFNAVLRRLSTHLNWSSALVNSVTYSLSVAWYLAFGLAILLFVTK